MIEDRTMIAILMLKQVDRDNSPLAEQPWNAEINEGGPPIDQKQDSETAIK